MTWEDVLPNYYEYLLYTKGTNKYAVTNQQKVGKWFSKELPFPFTFGDCQKLIYDLKKKGCKPTYINSIITYLNQFIRFCNTIESPQEDLCDELNKVRPRWNRQPDPNDLLSVDEVAKLICNPTNRPMPPLLNNSTNYTKLKEMFNRTDNMYSLLLELIYKTGCRSGEAGKLQKKHFNFSNNSLTFEETKTGDDRTVAMPPDMDQKLKDYVKDLNDTDFLFTNKFHVTERDTPVSQEMINRVIKNRAQWSGVERSVHVHMLRHSAITHMLINGAPLSVVQAIVGHRKLSTTQLYTHVIVENQREAMVKYNPLIRSNIDPILIYNRIKDFVKDLKLEDIKTIDYKINESKGKLLLQLSINGKK